MPGTTDFEITSKSEHCVYLRKREVFFFPFHSRSLTLISEAQKTEVLCKNSDGIFLNYKIDYVILDPSINNFLEEFSVTCGEFFVQFTFPYFLL